MRRYLIILEDEMFCQVVSAVTTKVKGLVLTNYSDSDLVNVPRDWKHLYNRIWDVTDFVVPAQVCDSEDDIYSMIISRRTMLCL